MFPSSKHSINSNDTRRLKQIINIACLDKLFSALESSGQPKLGEAGSRLSGGQKQRIGIARAIASGTNILIFDEVTSALDSDTEKIVLDNICRSLRDEAVVMISHRPYPLSLCDRVYKMEDGKLTEVQKN